MKLVMRCDCAVEFVSNSTLRVKVQVFDADRTKKRKTRGCGRKTEIRREFERYTENICTLVVSCGSERQKLCLHRSKK